MADNAQWIVTDNDSLKVALDGMRRSRRLTWEDIFRKIGGRMVGSFFHGRSENLRCDSLFKVLDATDHEIVIRRKSTPKLKERLDAVRRQHEAAQAAQAQDEIERTYAAEGRDETGRLKHISPQVAAEVAAVLDKYGSL